MKSLIKTYIDTDETGGVLMRKLQYLALIAGILLFCGSAHAESWSADALGESSGLDRGALLIQTSIPAVIPARPAVNNPESQPEVSDEDIFKTERREEILESLATQVDAAQVNAAADVADSVSDNVLGVAEGATLATAAGDVDDVGGVASFI